MTWEKNKKEKKEEKKDLPKQDDPHDSSEDFLKWITSIKGEEKKSEK